MDGIRTIAGLGSWEGWVTSVEMELCQKLGYKFEVLKGYKFQKDNIFRSYVERLYTIRTKYDKNDPMNLIAKLLMNSLYGKFGMKSESSIVTVYDSRNSIDREIVTKLLEESPELIQDHIRIGHHLLLQTSAKHYQYDQKEEMYHGLDVNVAIASLITASARVLMSNVKNDPDMKVYYTDTDSIVTDTPLPKHLVGGGLGQFKLEYEIKKAVFLAPKVYGIVTTDGKEIIKVKGLTKDALANITIEDLEYLLIRNQRSEIAQSKWRKNAYEGKIEVMDTTYSLTATNTKRKPQYITYNLNGEDILLLTKSQPYIYSDIEVKDSNNKNEKNPMNKINISSNTVTKVS